MKKSSSRISNNALTLGYKVSKRNASSHRFTLKQVRHFIEEKCAIKVINEDNKNFLLKILNKCPDEALNIYTWATLSNSTGLMFKPSFTYVSSNKIHYLTKNNQLSFNQGGINHRLVIGDNYFALLNLLIPYRNKINIIYIDPPYGCDNMGECAGVNYKNNYSRDDLLSMLKPRLELARELLADYGVMFCSIDDRNYAYVKLLFDEVFDEKNFVCSAIWQKKTGGGMNKIFYEGHEYVLIYAKSKENLKGLYEEKELKIYKPTEGIYKDMEVYDDIYAYCKYNGRNDAYDEQLLLFSEIKKFKPEKEAEINAGLKTGELYLKQHSKKKDDYIIVKRCLATSEARQKVFYTIIKHCFTKYGSDMLNELGLMKEDGKHNLVPVFDHSKPVQLMKLLLNLTCDKNALILDFFAGSGTTGQAVLELNREDGGNRQFILCVNQEADSDKICYERLHRVMVGKTTTGRSDFAWISKNQPLGDSLDVNNIDECADNDPNVFAKIDQTCYFPNSSIKASRVKFKQTNNAQAKRDWVCREFQITCKEKQINKEK